VIQKNAEPVVASTEIRSSGNRDSRKRILVNCTTLKIGGAVQASVNFISTALNDNSYNWFFILSTEVAEQLKKLCLVVPNDKMIVFAQSPARSFFVRFRLKRLIRELSPDVVFTFFGPAYVKIKCQHVMGFADPWVLNPNDFAWSILSGIRSKKAMQLSSWYKKVWLRFADCWIVETNTAKTGLVNVLRGVEFKQVKVVENGCRDALKEVSAKKIRSDTALVRILCLTAYYPHKNLEIIPYVASEMKRIGVNAPFSFLLSLDPNSLISKRISAVAKTLQVDEHISFLGVVDVADVPKIYENSHLAFVPSVLEVFSAAYSEAMTVGMPIVTTDLPFAHDVCGSAAEYFRPTDAEHAARMLSKCINEFQNNTQMVEYGLLRASQLPDGQQKYRLYRDVLDSMFG
jgi:glycosyltransferase involved in cell wall biosynthesis